MADGLRYRRLMDQITAAIGAGVYAPGDRLPSLRATAAQAGVSLATAVRAYDELAASGRIVAVPQSGFIVRGDAARLPTPGATVIDLAATPVSVAERALRLMQLHARPGIVDLGASLPDASVPGVRELRAEFARVARLAPAAAGYDVPPGDVRLRQWIARRYVERGWAIAADDVVLTSGCQEALALALRHATRPGERVAVESPAFYGLLHVIEAAGLQAVEIPTDPATGMSLEALQLALDRLDVRAVLVTPAHGNPTGHRMPAAARERLVRIATAAGAAIVEDDVFAELGHDGAVPAPLAAADASGRTACCGSFSKSLDPGLRVGWVIAPAAAPALAHSKLVTSMALPALAVHALRRFLRGPAFDRHLRQVRRLYRERVAQVQDVVASAFPPGTRITRPVGGFVLWIELPEGCDAVALADRALAEGISVAPGSLFSASARYDAHLRVCAARLHADGAVAALRRVGGLAAQRG